MLQRKLYELAIVPVVVLEDAKDASLLAGALCSGGLPCAEVTFRTDAAQESIRVMRQEYPQMLIGAGTVLTRQQVDQAMQAGADFIVCPGFDPEIVDDCKKNGIPVFPGVVTPTELTMAVRKKLRIVKFFPAAQFGGVSTINALSAPFQNVWFMPTGGVNEANLQSYLSCPRVIACGGSWMVKSDLIREGRFDEITRLTAQAVKAAFWIRQDNSADAAGPL